MTTEKTTIFQEVVSGSVAGFAEVFVDHRPWGAMEQPTDLRFFCRS